MNGSASRILTGVIAEKFAERVGVPEEEQRKFLVLGYALGSRPVGLAVTLVLANKEAAQAPVLPPVAVGKPDIPK